MTSLALQVRVKHIVTYVPRLFKHFPGKFRRVFIFFHIAPLIRSVRRFHKNIYDVENPKNAEKRAERGTRGELEGAYKDVRN